MSCSHPQARFTTQKPSANVYLDQPYSDIEKAFTIQPDIFTTSPAAYHHHDSGVHTADLAVERQHCSERSANLVRNFLTNDDLNEDKVPSRASCSIHGCPTSLPSFRPSEDIALVSTSQGFDLTLRCQSQSLCPSGLLYQLPPCRGPLLQSHHQTLHRLPEDGGNGPKLHRRPQLPRRHLQRRKQEYL